MKRSAVVVWCALLILSGCANRQSSAPPESLGHSFIISQIALKDGGAKVTFALHLIDQKGKLKVCGLYLTPSDRKVVRIVAQGINDISSRITFGTTDASMESENIGRSESIQPDFLLGYSVSPMSPLAYSLLTLSDRDRLLKDLNSEKLYSKLANCISTDINWNESFLNHVKISLNKTNYQYLIWQRY